MYTLGKSNLHFGKAVWFVGLAGMELVNGEVVNPLFTAVNHADDIDGGRLSNFIYA